MYMFETIKIIENYIINLYDNVDLEYINYFPRIILNHIYTKNK